jgi:Cd2+/Zn2+-exporting ATPase/Cu+-exporting ATPase
MSRSTAELELVVPELDCADEAVQIRGALGRLTAVRQVRTSVAAHKVFVTYDPAGTGPEAIRAAIAGLGMTAREGRAPVGPRRASLPSLLTGLFVAAVALVALVGILAERLGLLEAVTDRLPPWLTLAAVLVGGLPIFRNVVRALRNRTVTSHALMTLGIVGALAIGQIAAAAVIVFFMRFADFLEGFTTDRSRQAVRELLKLAPETARVEQEGRDVEMPAEAVRPGQIVVVKAGERIPVDGRVVSGHGALNQAPVTGESMPVERNADDRVFAATVLERGFLRVETERVGTETTFGRILKLVEEAEAHKAPVQRFADRFTAYYIPVVVGAALLTYLLGRDPSAAVAVVLVACSCAIAMATPTAVLASVGRAARRGVIVKGGRSLEALAKVDTLVMDKTGTVTFGTPRVTEIVSLDHRSAADVLACTAAVERYSEHAVASAVLAEAQSRGLAIATPDGFEVLPGAGVAARVDGVEVACGNERLMERRGVTIPSPVRDRVHALEGQGRTVVYLAEGERLFGFVGVADTLRPEVPSALARLKALGIRRVLLLTGDNERVARALGGQLGVEYRAECLPQEKIDVVKRLQAEGAVVVMVGDGINDAPALAQADVGIAMGAAGTDAAIEAAHVALMRDDWSLVPEAVQIGRRAFATIRQNLWFTAAYNAAGILLAGLGWLPPIAAAAAQSLPDVAVMLNSSRLLRAGPASGGGSTAPRAAESTGTSRTGQAPPHVGLDVLETPGGPGSQRRETPGPPSSPRGSPPGSES